MPNAVRGAMGAVGFLTCVPLTRGRDLAGREAVAWFAPVGAGIGLMVGAVWWGAHELWPPLLAGTLAVAADAAVTGMLHLDGLVDSADGLLPPLDQERRLSVMSDPRAGAFGAVALILVLALRIGALTSLSPDVWLIVGLWGASRAAMGAALATMPYARRDGGLASAFAGTSPTLPLVGGGLALGVVMVAGDLPAGLAAAVGLVAGAAAVLALAHRRIGGFTGDVLGAAGVVGETCGLLLAAARW
jgi:adenosylcobinamide-GDP ribazoletransferase